MTRPSSDYRATLTAVLRLSEPGTVALLKRERGWYARAQHRSEFVFFHRMTLGAALRALLRDLKKRGGK